MLDVHSVIYLPPILSTFSFVYLCSTYPVVDILKFEVRGSNITNKKWKPLLQITPLGGSHESEHGIKYKT